MLVCFLFLGTCLGHSDFLTLEYLEFTALCGRCGMFSGILGSFQTAQKAEFL